MISHARDRLQTSAIHIGSLDLTWTRRPFAYSLYLFGRRAAWKPIDYTKAAA